MYLRNNPTQTRRSLALVVSILVIAVMWMTARIEAQEKERPRSAEAQKLKNPLSSDSETVDAGKKLYQRHCASCHGAGAKGDGGMSLSGGTPSDLTDETWDYGSTDGEIFVAIRDGVSADMLAYKEKLNEKQIWQVVTFLRTLGPKPSK